MEAKIRQKIYGPGSMFELGEETIAYADGFAPHHEGVKYPVFKSAPQTLVDLFQIPRIRGMMEKEFLVYENDRYTFQQAFDRAGELGYMLVNELGVKRGDRVTIVSRNCPEYIISFLAIVSIGAVAVPMNSWWLTEELEYGLNNSGSVVVICDQDRLNRLLPAKLETVRKILLVRAPDVKLNDPRIAHYEDVLKAGAGKEMPPFPCEKDENAIIMYTSGTTGHPKGCVMTHRGVTHALNAAVANAMFEKATAMAKGKAKQEDDKLDPVVLLVVPLFHATGLHAVFLLSLIVGRKIVFMYKWNPAEALALIEREKVTTFTGVPTMVLELMQHPDFSKYDTSTLGSVGGGGAPPPPSMINDVGKKFKKAAPSNGYGMTETNAVIAINSAENLVKRPTSCGRPAHGVTVEIWDDNNNKLPPNTPGRVMLKGANMIREYWKNPEATAKSFTRDGFFDSGDIGKLDEENYLYILDRQKDLIIRGGENISCAEVEAAVYENQHVSEAAVFAVPHKTLIEEVAVAVFPKPGCAKHITLESIRTTCEKHIAPFKRPTHLFIWPEQLPRGATGKILKRQIRDMVENKQVVEFQPQSKL